MSPSTLKRTAELETNLALLGAEIIRLKSELTIANAIQKATSERLTQVESQYKTYNQELSQLSK